MSDVLESLLRMMANGKPEVEDLKGEVPITDKTDFESPSVERRVMDGTQKIWRFNNGYGASVVKHLGSYGAREGLWELAVLKFEAKGDWALTYETDISDDVVGHQTPTEIEQLLLRIKNLEEKP